MSPPSDDETAEEEEAVTAETQPMPPSPVPPAPGPPPSPPLPPAPPGPPPVPGPPPAPPIPPVPPAPPGPEPVPAPPEPVPPAPFDPPPRPWTEPPTEQPTIVSSVPEPHFQQPESSIPTRFHGHDPSPLPPPAIPHVEPTEAEAGDGADRTSSLDYARDAIYLAGASVTAAALGDVKAHILEEVVFDLTNLAPHQRQVMSMRLTAAGVAFRWEGNSLVASTTDASAVSDAIADLQGAASDPAFADVDVDPAFADIEVDAGPSADAEAPADPVALGDETVFELITLSSEQRRHLSMRLTGAGIAHRWEVGTDLIVSTSDADQIEFYVQEVQNPDGFADEELEEFDEDVDDEAVYSAMSNLYVAADRLMQRPADGSTVNAFYDASDDVEGLPAPFGFDPRVWAQVLGLANSIADSLDAEADPDTIGTDARTLRELLVNYV